jgi:hypothetical protein
MQMVGVRFFSESLTPSFETDSKRANSKPKFYMVTFHSSTW